MIRGWCPSLHEPMATGDGLLIRVKPPRGHVSAAAAHALAAASVAYGNGVIELTGRGALQFRGLTPESAEPFAAVAVGLDLAVADAAQERRRSILVSPLAGLDPDVAPATISVAASLEAAIVADPALSALPAKFGFAVDGGGTLPLGAGADITLVVGADRCWIVPDGAGQAAVVDRGAAVATVLLMAHAFLAMAGDSRRMRAVAASIFAACGLAPMPFVPAMPGWSVGRLGCGAFGAGLPFGSTDATTLRALADIAAREGEGDGVLRLTPWRSVLLAGVTDPAPIAALGLITSPDDPMLLISACPGQPGCASASVATRVIAAGLRPTATVHVSGCSKGCAHPGPAGLTFVGREGRFDLVRDGRAGDIPVQRGLTLAEVMQLQ